MKLTPEQKDGRYGYIGSGHSSAVMSRNPYATKYDVWAQVTGKVPPIKMTPPMQAGLILESAIIDWLEIKDDIEVKREVDCFSGDSLHVGPAYCGAHLDGIYTDGEGNNIIVEAKTSGLYNFLDRDEWGDEETDQVPVQYIIQCHHQMICCGAEVAVIPALIPPLGFRKYVVRRNEEVIDAMLATYEKFWDCVKRDVPPDDSIPSLPTIKNWVRSADAPEVSVDAALVSAYEQAAQSAKDAGKVKDLAFSQLMMHVGDAECASFEGGILTYRAAKNGSRRLYIKREKNHAEEN